jgi:hypothetical protein
MQIMDCRSVEFSPEKSEERIQRALQVFPRRVLMRVLAFALHLLGARRKVVAALVEMPEESVKTAVGLALRGGFPALRDRRLSAATAAARASPSPPKVSVRQEQECCVVDFGAQAKTLTMPISNRVQVRAVLLSLLSAELLSVQETASSLGISAAHCRELARKLASQDVAEALVDKRQGQQHDYRVGPEQKAEIIQQIAARAVTGHCTSSAVLAEQVNQRTQAALSARTIRWHIHNLGLTNIRKTLPPLVAALKKTADDSP